LLAVGVRPGTLIVFEGLDKAGKSAQASAVLRIAKPETLLPAHMPEGFTEFTNGVYELLEDPDRRPSSGVARQLAHLACHAESIPRILEALESRAVRLDRWW
jgi:thymidylate kinase